MRCPLSAHSAARFQCGQVRPAMNSPAASPMRWWFAEECSEPAAHELGVLVHRAQPPLAQLGVARGLEHPAAHAADELPGERPVDEPDRGLERARPVGPQPVRAGDEPAVELLGELVEVLRLPARGVGLRQGHEVEMPVRRPQVRDVADQVGVAIVEGLAVDERRLDAAFRIPVPARRLAEVHAAQREDVESAAADALGRREVARGARVRGREHPGTARGREVRRGHRRRAHESEALGVRLEGARPAERDLRGRHAAQAVQQPARLRRQACR